MDESTLPQGEAPSVPPRLEKAPADADADSSLEGFGKMPAEIRLQIWKYSLPAPRVLYLCWIPKPSRISLSLPHVASFSVNHESRAESIALLTHRGVATSTSEESTKPQRHFFSKFDTALVNKRSLGTMAFQFFFWYIQQFIGQEGLSQIRHFALYHTIWSELSSSPKRGDCIKFIANLDKFTIFYSNGNHGYDLGNELELLEPSEELVPEATRDSMRSSVLAVLSESEQSTSKIPEIFVMFAQKKVEEAQSLPELLTLENLSLD